MKEWIQRSNVLSLVRRRGHKNGLESSTHLEEITEVEDQGPHVADRKYYTHRPYIFSRNNTQDCCCFSQSFFYVASNGLLVSAPCQFSLQELRGNMRVEGVGGACPISIDRLLFS